MVHGETPEVLGSGQRVAKLFMQLDLPATELQIAVLPISRQRNFTHAWGFRESRQIKHLAGRY